MNKVGEFVIKGLCYEDVLQILISNGYTVELFAKQQAGTTVNEREFRFKVYESEDK